jgi:hypothetical protein
MEGETSTLAATDDASARRTSESRACCEVDFQRIPAWDGTRFGGHRIVVTDGAPDVALAALAIDWIWTIWALF